MDTRTGKEQSSAEFRHILDNEAPRALSIAETIKDDRRAYRACKLATFALQGYGFSPAFGTPEAKFNSINQILFSELKGLSYLSTDKPLRGHREGLTSIGRVNEDVGANWDVMD